MSQASMEIVISAIDQASGSINKVQSGVEKLTSTADKFKSAGKNIASVGAGITGLAAPVLGMGVAAVMASTKLNGLLANVEALGVSTARVTELKTGVQSLAIATGTSTDLVAKGLYSVISAVGDTADTMGVLETNARLAKSGLATVEEAIALTTAVTKSYGDTSGEAFKQVSDLALKTVELGQTSLPELAAALPRVTSLAQNLGVSQEELFAVMATGTGVLGNAGEVATMTKAAFSGLMAPSEGLTTLFGELGVASGEALIKQEGFAGALQLIAAEAERTGVPLQTFLGSVEAQQLALGLSGPLADEYTKKLGAMGEAAGSTEKAFSAQTEGINKSGFAMDKIKSQLTVLKETMGDALAPSVSSISDKLEPMVNNLSRFAQANPGIMQVAVSFAAVAAAVGLALIAIGGMAGMIGMGLPAIMGAVGLISGAFSGLVGIVTMIVSVVGGALMGLVGMITLPGIAIAALVAGLVAGAVAIVMHWGQIKTFFAGLGAQISSFVSSAVASFGSFLSSGASAAAGVIGSMAGMASSVIASAASAGQGLIAGFTSAVGGVASAMASIVSTVVGALAGLAGQALAAGQRIVSSIADGIRAGIGAVGSAMSAVGSAIAAKLPGSPVKSGPLVHTLNGTKNAGYRIAEMLGSGLNAGSGLLNAATDGAVSPVASTLSTASPSSGSTSSTFAPSVTINVNGGESDVAGQIDKQLEATFARLYQKFQAQQARVSYG